MAEKEFLMRKVQFLQHYGSVVPSSLDSGGFFTENRSNLRKGGDLKVHRDLQKLNVRIFFHGTFISRLISLVNAHFFTKWKLHTNFHRNCNRYLIKRLFQSPMKNFDDDVFNPKFFKKCWKRFYGHVNCPLNNSDTNQSQHFSIYEKSNPQRLDFDRM